MSEHEAATSTSEPSGTDGSKGERDAPAARGPLYWRRLEAIAGGALDQAAPSDATPRTPREFADGADVLEMDPVSRRAFLQLMGASLALAGVTQTGCGLIRKPAEEILPYAKRPEDLVPGMPRAYATTAWIGGSVLGLLVESHEGRPTKIEGNPSHPSSGGGTTAWAQAEILGLYDPDRSTKPRRGADEVAWADADKFLKEHVDGLKASGGLAVLVDSRPSPTLRRLLRELQATVPGTRLFVHEPARPGHARAGAALAGLRDVAIQPALESADVVVALDCDFLGVEPDAARNARAFASRRRPTKGSDPMNRLYVAEPGFSITGGVADHRLRVRGADIRGVLAELAAQVLAQTGVPEGAQAAASALESRTKPHDAAWILAVAQDLVAARGRALVLVGERQPAEVHALAHLVNAALGAPGATLRFMASDPLDVGSIANLAAAIQGGQVKSLVLLNVNPAYDAPADLDFPALMKAAGTTIHLGQHHDETGRVASWHLPASHFLEAWGDLVDGSGTLGIQQPLIEPLHGTISDIELLGRALSAPKADGLSLVSETWRTVAEGGAALDDATWRRLLQVGAMAAARADGPWTPLTPAFDWSGLATALQALPATGGGIEIDFFVDNSVHDGRYANNGWLQELPDPMTKLTWDNAACMSPSTAASLSVKNEDVVAITAGGRTLEAAAWITPGLADQVVALSLGYGRKAGGRTADGSGFDAYALRTTAAPSFVADASVSKTGGTYRLATTQERGELTEKANILGTAWEGPGRQDLVREGTLAEWAHEPEFVREMDVIEPEHIKSLWVEPNVTTGHQWGMTIDLSSCTGCSACTIACQAENNIPIVGKERVLVGREMHWIRVDRYYRGDEGDPAAIHQPIPCMQCENAPCEQVCPVAATAHSDDGLNDMAYNRCIGTRYCANNCPYKVRRFNYFNFNKENDGEIPLLAMQRNPDVTVRFRGVMEKCTYCVQRISRARIEAKVRGDGVIADGRVVPACAQACPSDAITFGDVNDPATAVSRAKAQSRNYSLLGELNTQPRTTYLARVRNPNPALMPAAAGTEAHG